MKTTTLYGDVLSNNQTGYTLTISGNVSTGQVEISSLEPIQGMPHSLILSQSISPEPQEERFLDEKLREFYRKKGL